MSYEHQTCTKGIHKVSSTLQYLKCGVIITSSIAGLQGNSIKYHTLGKDGTQILLVDSFNLLHKVQFFVGLMLLGVTRGAYFNFLVVSTISKEFH